MATSVGMGFGGGWTAYDLAMQEVERLKKRIVELEEENKKLKEDYENLKIDDVWLLNCVKASAAENIQKGIELGKRTARNKAIRIVKTDSGWGTAGHQLGKDLTERFKNEIKVQKVEQL